MVAAKTQGTIQIEKPGNCLANTGVGLSWARQERYKIIDLLVATSCQSFINQHFLNIIDSDIHLHHVVSNSFGHSELFLYRDVSSGEFAAPIGG